MPATDKAEILHRLGELDGTLVGSKGVVETVRGILWTAFNEVPTHSPQFR